MCMIEDCDEIVDVLSECTHKARVRHRCNECRRDIEPGETYLSEAYVLDHEFEDHKTCAHCQVARAWLLIECRGFLYSGIAGDIAEHAGAGLYGFGVTRLSAGMRRHWRRKDGRLWPIPKMPAGADQKAVAA